MASYDVSQICLNGHVITRKAEEFPHHRQDFCDNCGEKTIMECPACGKPIRGMLRARGIISLGTDPAPSFCLDCGKPYPWTARRLDAAKELADELDELSAEDREKLKGSLDDLVREGPRTEVAALRFKKVMAKVGTSSCSAMREIIVGILGEAAKRAVFGPT